MSIPSDLIVAGFIIILIIGLFAVGITGTIPVYVRNDFDNICGNYLKLLSINGELSSIDISNFETELEGIGLKSVDIDAPPSKVKWGSKVNLKVEAYYDYEVIEENLSKKNISKKLTFRENIRVFGLEN